MDASRDWVEQMLDTQGTALSTAASAPITPYQLPDLSARKSTASIETKKSPTPSSQETKRSSSQPKEDVALARAPSEKSTLQKLPSSKVSQGRSQSSGLPPSFKTPSVSSIPSPMSEDPAELAAINSGITKMVTEMKVHARLLLVLIAL